MVSILSSKASSMVVFFIFNCAKGGLSHRMLRVLNAVLIKTKFKEMKLIYVCALQSCGHFGGKFPIEYK
jgi:hypothetical protein